MCNYTMILGIRIQNFDNFDKSISLPHLRSQIRSENNLQGIILKPFFRNQMNDETGI